jgi:cob(I)alamin adenosyltransferase
MNKGLVHLYYGDGKGKTTASIGLIIRKLSYNKSVLLVQFMKTPQDQFGQFGEINFLSQFNNIKIKQFGAVDWVIKGNISKKAKKEVDEALNFLISELKSNKHNLVVADELLYTIDMGILKEEDIIKVIKEKPKATELVLTGSHSTPKKLIELSDYATNIKKIKHPYDKGIIARRSVEF